MVVIWPSVLQIQQMIIRFPLLALVFITAFASAEEITLKSNDGKEIKATVLGIKGQSIELKRADGKSFTIPLDRLSEDSQKLAREALAKTPGAIVPDLPVFPKDPKSPDDLPEKLTVTLTKKAQVIATLKPLKGKFVDPLVSKDPAGEKHHFKILALPKSDSLTLILSQTLTQKEFTFFYLTKDKETGAYSAPKTLTIPGAISGSHNLKLEPGISEIVFYDFSEAPE